MTRFLLTLLALVTLLGCQEPFLGDGEDDMRLYTGTSANGTLSNEDYSGRTVHLQANFQSDGSRPDASGYTVQFTVSPKRLIAPIIGVIPGNITPTADIVWSVEGNEVRRTVSVVNGLAVSGVGQGCRIEVYDETPAADASQSTEYDVSILLVPGVRAATQQVPFYAPLGIVTGGVASIRPGYVLVAPNDVGIIAVPQDIGATSVHVTVGSSSLTPIALTDANVKVSHVDYSGVLVKAYDPRTISWVPLQPQTATIYLYNLIPAGPGAPNLIYSIYFGIDG